MPHPPTRACEADHCHSHNEDEAQTGVGVGTLCMECGHWFPTDAALVDDWNAKADELGLTRVFSADEIGSCAHCSHDF